MNRETLKRMALPAVAGLLALAALADPKLPMTRDLRDALVVVDITRSMNVRDMNGASRLDAARETLLQWISGLPCGSRIGLAIFTERRSLTLFEPVEICADYASIAGSLQAMNWRMAWDGDSMIAKGLNHALDRAQGFGVPLVLITDGQEAPPLPYAGPDIYRGDSPGGVIVGAGGDTPAPIPMFDDLGRETGFYGPNDVQHAPSRVGPPPTDATERPGYHPRQNPYGESDLEGVEHLSALRADYLRALAAERGLGFVRLGEGAAGLDAALAANAPPRSTRTLRGLGPLLGLAALIALGAAWLTGRARSGRAADSRNPSPTMSRQEKLT